MVCKISLYITLKSNFPVASVSGCICLLWRFDTLKFIGICCNHPYEFTGVNFIENYPILATSDTEPCIILWDCREQPMVKISKGGGSIHTALNYEMPRYIKIELDRIFPDLMWFTNVQVDDLQEMKYEQSNTEAKNFAMRFQPNYPEWLIVENETKHGNGKTPPKLRPLGQNKGQGSSSKSYLSSLIINKPNQEERQLWYIAEDNGYIYLLELNSLINHLNIKQSKGISQMNNYDPMK